MLKTSRTLGHSPAAYRLARSIVKAAPTEASILVIGESGTGKEVVAKTIHNRSSRRDHPFVVVNCGAINPSLAESALFGHEKGSFTGAVATTMGYFERAHPGTLFLDEITEMPLAMQVQLLRVLENGQYHRVGGSELRRVNVRIIAATNRDPNEAVKAGIFRSDLLYRLAVFPMRLPSLRERKPDINYLSLRFLDELNLQENTHKVFSDETLARLENYDWPGNIRELKNTITRAYILSDQVIDIQPLSPQLAPKHIPIIDGHLKIPVGTTLTGAQRMLIMATLTHYSGDKTRTAMVLGISQKTLYNRLEDYRKHGYALRIT